MDNGNTATGDVIHIDAQRVRMSPRAMRMLTAATGRTMEQLMASDESADKFQAMAFIELHRRWPELDGATLWERAGDAEIELGDTDEVADPFGTVPSTTAPLSAVTGDSTPTP